MARSELKRDKEPGGKGAGISVGIGELDVLKIVGHFGDLACLWK